MRASAMTPEDHAARVEASPPCRSKNNGRAMPCSVAPCSLFLGS